jgi:hypothetical protein
MTLVIEADGATEQDEIGPDGKNHALRSNF